MPSKPLNQTLETLAHAQPQPITPPQRLNETWQRKWLKLQNRTNPSIEALARAVGQFCAGIWANPKSGYLLVLAGQNGCGKTHCGIAVGRWLRHVGHGKEWFEASRRRYIDLTFWRWPELIDHFKNGGWDVVSDMFDATVLILDDLGAGHDPTQIGTEKLSQLLSRRETKWTLVTTNFLPPQWENHFDRRIASRLLRNSVIVDLSGVPDFNA